MSYLDDYLRADDAITIIRGTTPTIMINIDDVKICDISVLHISFAQHGYNANCYMPYKVSENDYQF